MSPPKPLKIFSGGAMRSLLREFVPRFEREHGVTAEVQFQLSAALKRAIQDGAVFDIAILPRPELDELIALGAIVCDSAVDVARSTVGLAVRTGTAKPDIGSVETLRRALLQAQSIAYSDGPSGAYVADLLAKLGIAAAVAAKVKLTSGPVAELVARGEAELGMQQIIAILPVAGAELVGLAAGRIAKCHYLCRRTVVARFRCASGDGFPCLLAWRASKTAHARQWLRSGIAQRSACALRQAETAAKPPELAVDLGQGAEMLAPSRFYAHIGLTWGGSVDTYRPLFGRR
jgi:molybdate transport system substrate-binding protein